VLSALLHDHVSPATTVALGPTRQVDIRSTLSPFQALTQCTIAYPAVVVQALYQLFTEYNDAFTALVEANREWDTDYRYCEPWNFAVQIDVVGLPQAFLEQVTHLPVDEVREILRYMIFEIECSIAMYQLLEQLFPQEDQGSFFSAGWRATLDDIRSRTGRPIALLAVTPEKHTAILESEFGITDGRSPTRDEVFDLTGFDAYFGPDDFRRHVEDNGGDSEYLLFVRASDPVAKLRKPSLKVEHPLLSDTGMRRLIRANAITVNVDDPDGDPARVINDTKGYMPDLGMAFLINSVDDLRSPELAAYLAQRGIDPDDVLAGRTILRCKPAAQSFGCYGHHRGSLSNKGFRADLARDIRLRGPYMVQPELPTPRVIDTTSGVEYDHIDRVFISMVGGQPVMLGGFRNLMPADTTEAAAGRIHGNGAAVWAQVLPAA
jgi:hypothetical protein